MRAFYDSFGDLIYINFIEFNKCIKLKIIYLIFNYDHGYIV